MSNLDLKYWVGFSKIPSIGPTRFQKLLKGFSNLEAAWNSPLWQLGQAGLEERVIAEIVRSRQEINLDDEMAELEKENVQVMTILDKDYPKLLKEIYSPPPLLFWRGQLPGDDEFLLAVVGTRKPSSYGQHVTKTLARDLAQSGLTIVSGLALGIDSLAHTAALEANGKTMAVLGCGVERANIYPASNRYLGEKIVDRGGCIISEHPLGTPPLKHHFPRRNRIISGASLGTLVVEAPLKSGALLTAQLSLEQNREVFSVPGNITSAYSAGTNKLIKMGARVTTSAEDVLETLNLQKATQYLAASAIVPESEEETKILPLLKNEPIHVDELSRSTGLPIQIINATLMLMEMKGKVRHMGGMMYGIGR